MFKVTFAFENGSTVEAFANAGDNLLEVARSANVGTVKKRRTGLKENSSYFG